MTHAAPLICIATAQDVPAVTALVRDVLAEFDLRFGEGSATDTQLLGLPDSYAGGCFWVAKEDDALLGCAGVYPVAPTIFELRKMYLHPRARGTSVGAKLLDTAIAWTRTHGGTQLVLDTIKEMTRAIAFYEAHGFVRDDTQIRGSRCDRGYSLELSRTAK